MVLVVQIVRSQLLPLLDVSDGPAGEAEVFPGKADGVCHAGVVDYGCDREQSLNIHIPVRVLSNYIRIGVNDP